MREPAFHWRPDFNFFLANTEVWVYEDLVAAIGIVERNRRAGQGGRLGVDVDLVEETWNA